MALASILLSPLNQTVQGGSETTFTAVASGNLAQIKNARYSWIGLTAATELASGALKDDAGGGNNYGVAGGVMGTGTIEEGDEGAAEFVAAVPFANPTTGYPEFGGRLFFCGLTTQDADVIDTTDLSHALEVAQGGVSVYEQGVLKLNARAPRNNGRYYVGIESGKVVYRADDQVIYRSDLAPEYPLYLGAIFYHRETDQIGGAASSSFSYFAYDENGDAAGSWASNVWTAPNTRGRYRIVVQADDYVFAETFVYVSETYPNETNTNEFPQPSKQRQLMGVDDWKVTELGYDDKAATYNVPLPDAEQVRRWELTYSNLTTAQALVLDNFLARHKGKGYSFYFFDPRSSVDNSNGYTWDNCRIVQYEAPDHGRLHAVSQRRRVVIERKPV